MELNKDLTEFIKVTVEQECEENCAMSAELFNAIVRRWKLSNQFLVEFLRRSMACNQRRQAVKIATEILPFFQKITEKAEKIKKIAFSVIFLSCWLVDTQN